MTSSLTHLPTPPSFFSYHPPPTPPLFFSSLPCRRFPTLFPTIFRRWRHLRQIGSQGSHDVSLMSFCGLTTTADDFNSQSEAAFFRRFAEEFPKMLSTNQKPGKSSSNWVWRVPQYYLRDYSFEAVGLILICVFNIAGFIECLVGDTSLRLIYLLSVSRMKAYFTFTEYLYKVCNTSESLWSACFVSFSTTKFIIH